MILPLNKEATKYLSPRLIAYKEATKKQVEAGVFFLGCHVLFRPTTIDYLVLASQLICRFLQCWVVVINKYIYFFVAFLPPVVVTT